MQAHSPGPGSLRRCGSQVRNLTTMTRSTTLPDMFIAKELRINQQTRAKREELEAQADQARESTLQEWARLSSCPTLHAVRSFHTHLLTPLQRLAMPKTINTARRDKTDMQLQLLGLQSPSQSLSLPPILDDDARLRHDTVSTRAKLSKEALRSRRRQAKRALAAKRIAKQQQQQQQQQQNEQRKEDEQQLHEWTEDDVLAAFEPATTPEMRKLQAALVSQMVEGLNMQLKGAYGASSHMHLQRPLTVPSLEQERTRLPRRTTFAL